MFTTEAQRGKAASFQRSAFSGQLLESRGTIESVGQSGMKNLCAAQRNEELVVPGSGVKTADPFN
jgi:hypothetical protein